MKALFADSVADYDANRPGCPVPLYDFLIAECNMDGHSVIVDVGAGTGKGSTPLLDRGLRIIAVGAGEKMLTQTPRNKRRPRVIGGSEDMTLRGATVDVIIGAQSFHWFATTRTLSRFARVLKPEGRLALFWNTRRSEPRHQKLYEKLIVKYNPVTTARTAGRIGPA
jgi:ubiquinone/menaquinone biosynthesis C-methylase UbiE